MLIDFVSVIDKKKEPWSKSLSVCDLYKTFLFFSHTYPEVFLPTWTMNGDLFHSPVATVWVAANSILGLSWVLVVKIISTTKSNLKQAKKMLKDDDLTFSPECVSRKTSGGQFLLGTIQRVLLLSTKN